MLDYSYSPREEPLGYVSALLGLSRGFTFSLPDIVLVLNTLMRVSKPRPVYFSTVPIGECFTLHGRLYMKISYGNMSYATLSDELAVELESGVTEYIDKDTFVLPMQVTTRVEYCYED